MKNCWLKYSDAEFKKVMAFGDDYRKFLDEAKTERETCLKSIEIARAHGYKDISEFKKLKKGDKVYFNNRDKSLCLFLIGEKPLVEGMNILGAHIDSPRIDLKQKPLYESDELVLLDTHYYGGIKKYQWVAQPLSIHGVVIKKDGTKVNVVVGEKDSDPVVGISDLLIHLSQNQLTKKAANVVEGEDLNVLIGSIPKKDTKENASKSYILDLLKKDYGIEEDDFLSAELEIVPSGKARDYGLDRSMIMGYGHDDRICAYSSLMGLLKLKNVERTACCILVDKEEVGSQGATGMQSRFFENCVAEMFDKMGDYSELNLRKVFTNSYMLSSDVNVAFDPNYPEVSEKRNTCYLGQGVGFAKYTGSRGKSGCNDANPEFIAKIRKVLDDKKISYQTGELGRVDLGGGGTIAYILGNLNMEVVDCGVPVQNMHACYEVASKADLYEAYRCYVEFLKEIK